MTGDSGRLRWLPAVVIVGLVYLAAGIAFGALAGRAGSSEMRRVWRLAAWVISAVAFAAHLRHESLRGAGPRTTGAWHVALAAALGAFGLAVAANLHAWATGDLRHSRALALSLAAWPALTAAPAFLVALAALAGLSLVRRTD